MLDYLYHRQLEYGSVKFCTPSDSIVGGANYNEGLMMPFMAGLAALGIEAYPAGYQTDGSGNIRVLRNSYGGNYSNNSFGGKTTADVVTGTNGVGQSLGTMLTTYNPDIILSCIGTNDPPSGGYPDAFTAFWQAIDKYAKVYNPRLPSLYVSPFNSNDTNSNNFSKSATFDTGMQVTKEAYRDLIRKSDRASHAMFIDGMKAMGMFARYQSHDPTADVGNANMVFYDGTHPSMTGNAMLVAFALAQMAGVSPAYMLELMAGLEPYSPIDLTDAVDITAGNTASWGTAEDLKHVLLSLTVTNKSATTAAVATVYRSRYKNNLSGSTDTAALTSLYVPAGATRGWTFPCPGNVSKYATGPVAWYNERWKVGIASADCNVALTAKRMLV